MTDKRRRKCGMSAVPAMAIPPLGMLGSSALFDGLSRVAGQRITPASTAIIAITTSNSINVKPADNALLRPTVFIDAWLDSILHFGLSRLLVKAQPERPGRWKFLLPR